VKRIQVATSEEISAELQKRTDCYFVVIIILKYLLGKVAIIILKYLLGNTKIKIKLLLIIVVISLGNMRHSSHNLRMRGMRPNIAPMNFPCMCKLRFRMFFKHNTALQMAALFTVIKHNHFGTFKRWSYKSWESVSTGERGFSDHNVRETGVYLIYFRV
jgi:hypothetical protein